MKQTEEKKSQNERDRVWKCFKNVKKKTKKILLNERRICDKYEYFFIKKFFWKKKRNFQKGNCEYIFILLKNEHFNTFSIVSHWKREEKKTWWMKWASSVCKNVGDDGSKTQTFKCKRDTNIRFLSFCVVFFTRHQFTFTATKIMNWRNKKKRRKINVIFSDDRYRTRANIR